MTACNCRKKDKKCNCIEFEMNKWYPTKHSVFSFPSPGNFITLANTGAMLGNALRYPPAGNLGGDDAFSSYSGTNHSWRTDKDFEVSYVPVLQYGIPGDSDDEGTEPGTPSRARQDEAGPSTPYKGGESEDESEDERQQETLTSLIRNRQSMKQVLKEAIEAGEPEEDLEYFQATIDQLQERINEQRLANQRAQFAYELRTAPGIAIPGQPSPPPSPSGSDYVPFAPPSPPSVSPPRFRPVGDPHRHYSHFPNPVQGSIIHHAPRRDITSDPVPYVEPSVLHGRQIGPRSAFGDGDGSGNRRRLS